MKIFEAGELFGELAALRINTTRSLTVEAKTDATVYGLEADEVEKSYSDRPQDYKVLCATMRREALENYKTLRSGGDLSWTESVPLDYGRCAMRNAWINMF